MSVLGIGVALVSIDRIRWILDVPARFVASVFTVLPRRFDTLLAERGPTASSVSVSLEDEYVVAVAVLARAC